MKVKNQSIFVGDTLQGKNRQDELKPKINQDNKKSYFAGGLFQQQDKYLFHKNSAQKKAMKAVTDARKNEMVLDDEVKGRRQQIADLKVEAQSLYQRKWDLEGTIGQMSEEHGLTEEDLALFQKAGKSLELLNDEELARYQEIDPASDYGKALTAVNGYAHQLQDVKNELDRTEGQILALDKTNQNIANARLKNHRMVDAQKQYKKDMEAAAKIAANILINEAKDHVEEEFEKEVETAKEKAEQEKEEQEKIEAAKEKKEEQKEFSESVKENAGSMTEQVVEAEQGATDIKIAIKKIIEEEKILEEDLKGAAVDRNL